MADEVDTWRDAICATVIRERDALRDEVVALLETIEREEARHLAVVDVYTDGMPEERREWYRLGHAAVCELAEVLNNVR